MSQLFLQAVSQGFPPPARLGRNQQNIMGPGGENGHGLNMRIFYVSVGGGFSWTIE